MQIPAAIEQRVTARRERARRDVTVVSAIVALLAYMWFGNPDVAFQSSDGGWSDQEFQFKGREFEDIVYYFEEYKLRCAGPQLILVRTTEKPWLNILAWPSILTKREWKVPFVADVPATKLPKYCPNDVWVPGIENAIQKMARDYIARL